MQECADSARVALILVLEASVIHITAERLRTVVREVFVGSGVPADMGKACVHDMGMVAVRNCGHIGRLGEYAVQAAQAGFMGLVFSSGSAKGGIAAP